MINTTFAPEVEEISKTLTTTRTPALPYSSPVIKTALMQSRFLFLAFILLYASKTTTASTSQNIPKRQVDQDIECGFQGNNDAYGLGIRLAMYIQWITCLLISCFFKAGASSVIVITNCFQLSMIIALLYLTIQQGSDLQVSEAYLMLTICAGGVTTFGTIDVRLLHRFDRKDSEAYTAALGSAIQFSLQLVLSAYGIWFIFTGMDSMQHPPCSRSGFLLARVDLYHWVRTFLKVGFVSGILGLLFIPIFQIAYTHSDSRPAIPVQPTPPASGAVCEADLDCNPNLSTISLSRSDADFAALFTAFTTKWFGFVQGVGRLCMFILAVELTIKWNHIQDVNKMGSTGQILPFVVAVGGLMSATCQFLLQTVSVEASPDVEGVIV
ncbi:hypothetical protein Q9L58_001878 [Maublancomyces gigas]|uniref:Uncharacterized protein n=1 Tax=Discina gigas TaxID=1032678 RepID=A0ABR3GTF5_9PEZI